MSTELDRINSALDVARRYGGGDEPHHHAWVVDQMVRALTGNSYDTWIEETRNGENGPDTYTWNTGIAP